MEEKDVKFKHEIVEEVEYAVLTGMVPDVNVPDCGGEQAPAVISRDELIAKQASRKK